jgi:hypothetical protein
MNIIHKKFERSAIVYIDSDNIVYKNNNASIGSATAYAKLEPNTIYSVQKLDSTTSGFFVVGLSNIDLRDKPVGDISTIDCEWESIYVFNDTEPHTIETTDKELHCFLFYTTSSEFNTRIVMNVGDTIESYTKPSL